MISKEDSHKKKVRACVCDNSNKHLPHMAYMPIDLLVNRLGRVDSNRSPILCTRTEKNAADQIEMISHFNIKGHRIREFLTLHSICRFNCLQSERFFFVHSSIRSRIIIWSVLNPSNTPLQKK